MHPYGVIYLALNKIDGKFYIGKTVDFSTRIGGHLFDSKREGGFYFHRAIRKHGWNNFEWYVLDKCWSGNYTLCRMERFYIRKWKARDLGYNMTDGGEGAAGRIVSADTRKLISIANSGSNNGMFGVKYTPERSAAQSKATKGKKKSLQMRQRLSATKKGIPPSLAAIEAAKKKNTGIKRTQEFKDNVSKFQTGRKRSPEFCALISKIRTGTKRSEEAKRNMSLGSKTKIPVVAVNIKTKENLTFNSIKEASIFLNADGGDIGKCIKGKKPQVKGYTFTRLPKETP